MGWPFRFFGAHLFLLVAPLFAEDLAPPAQPSSEWVVRAWQTAEGLPQNTVNAILQTHDGFLWVGTSGGLARFDGIRFRKFGLQEGLRSVRISTLAEDSQGGLWLGTTGGGVSCWRDGQMSSFGAAEGFPSGVDVVSMASDRDGSIWIGTTQGLVQWRQGKFTRIGKANGLPAGQVRALAEDAEGSLWVSMIPGGVFRGSKDQFIHLDAPNATVDGPYSLLADRDGTVWGGSGSTLWRWRAGEWKRFDRADGLPYANLVSLAQDASGALWIGAENAGLYRARGDRFELAVAGGALSDTDAHLVAADCENCVWVGTPGGGLNRVSRRVLRCWGANAGLEQPSVRSVAEDAAGVLWLGAGGTGIFRFEDGRFSKVQDPGLAKFEPRIYCTTSAADGSIWTAGEQCLYHFQPGQPAKAFKDPPVSGEALRALCFDGKTLWIGTYYSTLLKCDGATVEVAAPRDSFGGDITSIVSESPGTLWVGSAGGLHRWENGRLVRTWDTRDGLLTANVLSLLRDADGTLWIGTRGGGLARLKDGHILNITSRQGLIDNVILQILADDLGSLWLGCNRGLMRLERRDIDALAGGTIAQFHPLIFGRNEGLEKEQCTGGHSPTACKTHDGRLIFPTVAGIAEIDPRESRALQTSSPRPMIDRVLVDGRAQPENGGLVIPPGRHRLELTFTAPLPSGGAWVQFRYRLDGLDKNWTVEEGDRIASYDGLGPGHYVFHVSASGNGGNWNDTGASLAITVQPFFFQRPWFVAACGCFLVLGGGAVVWWSARRRHRRQLAEFERTRLQQAELAHVSRVSLLGELSASLAHELNQPLAAILSNAQAALRFLADNPADVEETRACLADIADADRRASEIITRMRSMMKKGEAQMERRDINADIEAVLVLLHSDLVTRQVTVDTDLQPDLPSVRGDHIQLQQVMLNLIVNGCDAMQAAGSAERRIVVSTSRDEKGLVRISVADSGPGIPPELLERIFDPFYSTKSNGLGMGLSICRAIIKAHGGHLWAENNARPPGATLHFTLRAGPTG
jgi:signal transduction histidine kinase/ligand-binding sensor domain-containing protein